ncbi:MAG: 50S ribosomal protein L28 [Candidatus Uhrbacteria bacterium]|nr:50S ribosomal protein L28 [Candidatus Uhrbacteria bacterium]
MSRVCAITGRGPKASRSRSHSNVRSLRRQGINLQTIRIDGKKFRIAARTLKTLKKKGLVPTTTKKAVVKK